MKPEEYLRMYKLEDEHWWFIGKRYLINSFIKKGKGLTFLDLGCGTGANLTYLNLEDQKVGLDCASLALKFSKKRGHKNLVRASVLNLPFKSNSFDIIGCFDVLYHKKVDDELKALKEMHRTCRKEGQLIVTDCALGCLKSPHDEAVHARTRFNLNELAEKIRQSGFKIEKQTYYNFFLFSLIFLIRKINKVYKHKAGTDIKKTNYLANLLLSSILKLEAKLLKRISFPFGASVFVIAKKG